MCVRERMDLFMMMIFVARWIISRWLEISILTFGPIVLLCVWRRRKEGTRYSITTAERCYPPRTEREKKKRIDAPLLVVNIRANAPAE